MGDLSAHFSMREFVCPHCNGGFPRPRLLALLEKIRYAYGKPLVVRSGYRCPIHNKRVGGAAMSQHMLGSAADIPPIGLSLEAARRLGAVGCGLKGDEVVHVDVRDGVAQTWHY